MKMGMVMSREAMSDRKIEDNFNSSLQNAIDTGVGPPSEMGFNTEVEQAIGQVAREYPSVTAISVQNAKQAWRRQVSGAYAAQIRVASDAAGYGTGALKRR